MQQTRTRIKTLNSMFMSGSLSLVDYKDRVEQILNNLDWQQQIQFRNMTFA